MTEVLLVETPEAAQEAVDGFLAGDRLLCFDTETTGLDVRSGLQDFGRTLQVSWRPWDVAYVFDLTDESYRPYINRLFGLAESFVGHNVRFDIHVMATYGVAVYSLAEADQVHDTTWLGRLYDERDEKKLAYLSEKYLGGAKKAEQTSLKRKMRKEGWTWATVPVAELVQYGGTDAIETGRLYDFYWRQTGYSRDAYLLEQELSKVLYSMERTGVRVDRALLEEIISEEEEIVKAKAAHLEALAPGLNPNSPKQVKEQLLARGVEVPDTKAETLKAVDDELAHTLLEFREHYKTLNTYAKPWREYVSPDGRIHPSLNQMGAATGRFSSDRPNLQNVSKSNKGAGGKLRYVFEAQPGSMMVVADWDQMELRMYAHFAQDARMRQAFLNGEDLYQDTADLLGVSRDVGKMIMLASIYGAGPKTLKRQCIAFAFKFGMPEIVPTLRSYDWEAMHRKFHRAYAIKNLAELTEQAARLRGRNGEPYIRTLGGRRQRPKRVLLAPVNGYRQTIYVYKDLGNSLVQGSSADLMKRAIVSIAQKGYGKYLRLTVHDEVVLEVPNHRVTEVMAAIEEVMTHNEFVPPLTAGVSMGLRYGEAK